MRSRTFVVVALALFVLIAGAVGVVAYDGSRDDRVAEGVRVGSTDIGGLSADEARAKLERELLVPLGEPVVVRHGKDRFRLSAKKAKVTADVDAIVEQAVQRSREGGILGRTWRSLTGGTVDETLVPKITYDRRAVNRLVNRVRRSETVKPRDASVDLKVSGPEVVASRNGRRVDTVDLRKDIAAALTTPGADRTIRLRTRVVRPEVTTQEVAKKYPVLLTVNKSTFTLTLYRNLRKVKTYRVAVGGDGYPTPEGLHKIVNKAVNPAWNVPNSSWAGGLAGQVIPGGAPNNPLKARWMGIVGGAGIHGTDSVGSLGSAASHGCIRMAIPDVVELYDKVPVNTPIYIA